MLDIDGATPYNPALFAALNHQLWLEIGAFFALEPACLQD
jgi:hypothetical protein